MRRYTFVMLAAVAALSAGSTARAFTFVTGDANAGGIGYYGYVTVGGDDTGSFKSHVGAWSWQDQGIAPGGGEGWTHTSNWIALDVTSATTLTLLMQRDSSVPYFGSGNVGGFADIAFMYPSFTIWSGWDNDVMTSAAALALGYDPFAPPDDHHTYANTGNPIWAEDLSYIDHTANSTLTSVTESWLLSAGHYTIVLGSDAPSLTSPPRQGYSATFTTSTAPEPGRAALLVLAGLGAVSRRRRHA
ncbi:MAG: PEP-CTERM sorting domain-containing protein [Verrucomicrobiaceae bacterium]|nr:PEP-CTERM sorting domain-containing protein [Verrucomicrobiaceae bacterium]